MIWVEMRRLPLLPGRQSGRVLAGSAAAGEGAITGVSLGVTSPVLSADPALTKNYFARLGTLQTLLKAKDKDIHCQHVLCVAQIKHRSELITGNTRMFCKKSHLG